MADKQTNVSTIVRDDFFNDPFFKDWWADFDLPLARAGKQLDRWAKRAGRHTTD